MPALASDLRRQLESVIIQARDLAETAAESALKKRAVDAVEPHPHFGDAEKDQRNRLRAPRGRPATRRADKTQAIDQLTQELAYEYWHRMLFARFLAENHLLMHPDGVAVSLEECDELAPTADPSAPNGFALAARFAGAMLPQIFRTDDVLLDVEFAPEHRLAMEKLLAALPRQTFLADDSLGWCYQFWQTKRKDQVNKTGDKIDGRTLSAVTQLFTEHYMVQFLLHNTIGAWWCGRHGVQGPAGGAGVPAGQSPVEMEYLRWRDDGTPAAGTFDGWPKTLAEFTMLDPCCGSGHFLVAAFHLLVPLRMRDEGLSARAACDAVLRDNLYGLELDPRCTQIAAFALALAAWKYPGDDGQPLSYRVLPTLNIACSGQGVAGKKDEWLKLANGDLALQQQIERLYDMFVNAPDLGSLIDPVLVGGPLFKDIYADLHPRLAKRLAKFVGDADQSAVGVAAQGIAKAAELLAKRYTLVVTNVPYLGRGKQNEVMKEYVEQNYKEGKADLATAFVMRCLDLCKSGSSTALVTPQNWLFLTTYTKLREKLLKERTWNVIARLGPRAFETITGEVVNVTLVGISSPTPADAAMMAGLDVADATTATDKAARLAGREPTPVQIVQQADQLRNPDAVVVIGETNKGELLSSYAHSHKGISTGDDAQFVQAFWEQSTHHNGWINQQSAADETGDWKGLQYKLLFEAGKGRLRSLNSSQDRDRKRDLHGLSVWGKRGVSINLMGGLEVSLFTGESFDTNVSALVLQPS